MQEGTKSAGKLVVSRGDASELLEPIEEHSTRWRPL